MTLDPFVVLLATTTALRGLGAGMILGVSLMTLPVRHRLGLIPYAAFLRAHYREPGVRVYAATTVLGSVLTITLLVMAMAAGEPPALAWLLAASLAATVLGFVGTGLALPAMRRLRVTADDNEAMVAELLDRFARWGTFSAVGHTTAFLALVGALSVGEPGSAG